NGVAKSIAFEHSGNCLESISIKDCGFIMLRGRYATSPPTPRPLGPAPGLLLSVAPPALDRIDPAAVYDLLTGPRQDIPVSIRVTGTELGIRFTTWLNLQPEPETGPAFGSIVAMGEAAGNELVPFLFGIPGRARSTMGLFADDGIALLEQIRGEGAPVYAGDETPFELYIRSFGQSSDLAQQLAHKVSDWDRAGRPPDPARLKIRACPKDYDYKPAPNELVSERPNVNLVIQW
ncbi:MAG TPA: hypothetical protein VI756_08690, partial [Blastocatellia bacterium]